MSQLTSYQWTSTHNTVSDGRFGAPLNSESQTWSGAWRSDGRSELYLREIDGRVAESGFFRRYIKIGDQAAFQFANDEIFATSPDALQGIDASLPDLSEDGRRWSKGTDREVDGRQLFAVESVTEEHTGPRSGDPDGLTGHRTTSTTYFIDTETFIVMRKSEQIRSELPVLGLGGTELQSTLRSVNTIYFAFDEPVDIEFPEGIEPAASP